MNKDNCRCRSYVSVVKTLISAAAFMFLFLCIFLWQSSAPNGLKTESNIVSNFGPIVCHQRTKSLNTPLSSVNSLLLDSKRNDLPLYYHLVLWVMYPLNVWKWFSWFGLCFVLFLKALLEMCFCLKVSPFVAKINLSSPCIEHVVCVAEWLFLMDVTPPPCPPLAPLSSTHPYRLMWGQVFLFMRFSYLNSLLLISSLIPCVCGS